jgi:hypothetical protein
MTEQPATHELAPGQRRSLWTARARTIRLAVYHQTRLFWD